MTKLVLVRGLPGSGKSTYARSTKMLHFEADQFFEDMKGNYSYDIKLIAVAHDWCFSNAVKALRCGYDVVVSNTFTKLWELDRYLGVPLLLPNVEIEIVEMKTQYQNVHGVPEDKLKQMAARWEDFSESDINFKRVE